MSLPAERGGRPARQQPRVCQPRFRHRAVRVGNQEYLYLNNLKYSSESEAARVGNQCVNQRASYCAAILRHG